jgi:hypothetical protein
MFPLDAPVVLRESAEAAAEGGNVLQHVVCGSLDGRVGRVGARVVEECERPRLCRGTWGRSTCWAAASDRQAPGRLGSRRSDRSPSQLPGSSVQQVSPRARRGAGAGRDA